MKSSSILIAGLAITLLETSAPIASGIAENSSALANIVITPTPQILLTEHEAQLTEGHAFGEFVSDPLGIRMTASNHPWRLLCLADDLLDNVRKSLSPDNLYIQTLYPGKTPTVRANLLNLKQPQVIAQGDGKEKDSMAYFCLMARLNLETEPEMYQGQLRFLLESEDGRQHQDLLRYECNVKDYVDIEVEDDVSFGQIESGEHFSNPVHLRVTTNNKKVKIQCLMSGLQQDNLHQNISPESIAIACGVTPRQSLEAAQLQRYGTTQAEWSVTDNVTDLYLCTKVKIGLENATGEYTGVLNVSASFEPRP